MGTYSEINETGFNIKDILDSYNKSMKKSKKVESTKFEKEIKEQTTEKREKEKSDEKQEKKEV